MNQYLIKLLQQAELNVSEFAIHTRREMNFRDRAFSSEYMMSYHKTGTAKLRIGDAVYEIVPGSVIFIPPHLIHDQYKDTDDEAVILWWHFTYKVERVLDVLPLFQIPYIYQLKQKERFETVFEQLMESRRNASSLPAAILQKAKSLELLYLLFDEAIGQRAAADTAASQQSFLGILCQIVQQPEKPLSLTEMAQQLHLNTAYVSSRFKELYGMSPIGLQRRLRIEKAKALLLTDLDMSVTQVAEALHFSEVTNFTRLFKKYTGMAPIQYRRFMQETIT
ncbi:AraC family transcriptional regulator [Paenibacillus sp. BC26]|uniref:helix-turn-helix transcriptional regulator n=1 Tax=Paenibacillus sp. BC26 TaxID=1881032 RepID=UPI0008DF3CE5|nr:helix-turn-helix domain-containing protein [Paenibacillus sp. BC26]SFS48900.1 AraC-type DNA-binding protein [Paenibacillus sp. BC26]